MRLSGVVPGLAIALSAVFYPQPIFAADPTDLTASVNSQLVVLRWQGDGTQWVIQAGSAPGLSDLANAVVSSPNRVFVASNVPPGTYYVRVRAVGGAVASNEVVVHVACGLGELDLRSQKSGLQVQLDWSIFIATPTLVRLEVGSAPGLSNILVAHFPPFPSRLRTVGPPGTYYIRARGLKNCGAGAASNEIRLDLGTSAHCVPTFSPAGRTVTVPGTYSFNVSVPGGCTWNVFTRDTGWITPLTLSGTGPRTIFYRVSFPFGGNGQIYVTTSSGRYFFNISS
jgi:hypothetical protein